MLIVFIGIRHWTIIFDNSETAQQGPKQHSTHGLYFVRYVMAHAQKPDSVFPRNGRVRLNRWGRQFSRLLAAEVCASAWVMLDTPRTEVAWEYWLPTPFASFPFTSPPVRHRVPPGSERALQQTDEILSQNGRWERNLDSHLTYNEFCSVFNLLIVLYLQQPYRSFYLPTKISLHSYDTSQRRNNHVLGY